VSSLEFESGLLITGCSHSLGLYQIYVSLSLIKLAWQKLTSKQSGVCGVNARAEHSQRLGLGRCAVTDGAAAGARW